MRCDRCGKESLSSIGSMFNMQQICMGCKDEEKKHPRYEEAVAADEEAIRRGDYNFPGIGWTPPILTIGDLMDGASGEFTLAEPSEEDI